MDKKKVKKIILIVFLITLIIVLLVAIGFFAVIFSLQNSGDLFEFQMSIPVEPVRDFIVDSFESFLPKN